MNWRDIERRAEIQRTEVGGREGERVERGLAKLIMKKSPATTRPIEVIWLSPCFTPSMERVERVKAVTRQLTPRILYIWSIVTSVQRPWRAMCLQHSMLVPLRMRFGMTGEVRTEAMSGSL